MGYASLTPPEERSSGPVGLLVLLALATCACGITGPTYTGNVIEPLPTQFNAWVGETNACLVDHEHIEEGQEREADSAVWLNADDLGVRDSGYPIRGRYDDGRILLIYGRYAEENLVRHEWVHHMVAPEDTEHEHPAFRVNGPERACDTVVFSGKE